MSCLIACSTRLVLDFDSRLDSDQWLCVPWDFDPRRDPTQPDLARPAPGHAPLAPLPPHAPLASPPAWPMLGPTARASSPAVAPLPSVPRLGGSPLPLPRRPGPAVAPPGGSPSLAVVPFPAVVLSRARAPVARNVFPSARPSRARHLNFGLINFKFTLVDVLRLALCRTTVYFKFTFINELRRALHRATIHLNFRLFNVWRRASSRAMFRIKFSLDDVCRRALRRATLNIISIIIQVPRGALRRATSRFILNSV
jgi:hypothetical protein